MKIIDVALANGDGAETGVTDYGLKNPLDAESIQELIEQILEWVYKIGLPIVVVMFVYAGFLYVIARGNETEIKKAHTAIKYTVIGAAIVLGAFVIATAIRGTIESLGPGGLGN